MQAEALEASLKASNSFDEPGSNSLDFAAMAEEPLLEETTETKFKNQALKLHQAASELHAKNHDLYMERSASNA